MSPVYTPPADEVEGGKDHARLYQPDGPCVPISKHRIVKSSPSVSLAEAITMKFVAENTLVPVPKVYCSFVRKNRIYIVMERIQGKELTQTWKKLPEESRGKILTQWKHMICELRALKQPHEGAGARRVENCIGGSLYDSRIPPATSQFGPFETIQEFHRWLRDDLQMSDAKAKDHPGGDETDWQDIRKMIEIQDGPWPQPVFTHGDLNPFNILVRGDDVVGIIDWEFSGW